MFISITFRGTIIDETNKTQQKVRGSKFTFKMSTIYANTCIQTNMPLRNRCCDDGVAMQLPLTHTHTHVYLTKQATRKGEAPIVLATRDRLTDKKER